MQLQTPTERSLSQTALVHHVQHRRAVTWRRQSIMGMKCTQIDHLWHDIPNGVRTNKAHIHLQLGAQQVDRMYHAIDAICRVSVQERTSNAHSCRPHGNGLENVSAPSESAVHQDLERWAREHVALAQLTYYFFKDFHAGASIVKLTAAMIR